MRQLFAAKTPGAVPKRQVRTADDEAEGQQGRALQSKRSADALPCRRTRTQSTNMRATAKQKGCDR
ncbi:MAG: hypothetical protein HFF84_13220 [Oscillibacter sp.]|nr:hypothetical protein [Oscillibacter sp.]